MWKRPRTSRRIEIDPDWVEANIVTETLPLIGPMRCHRDYVAKLRVVMEWLEANGHDRVITRSSNRGCFNQRFIAGRRDLSRHAWGVAVDINLGNSLTSTRSPVAPPLLEATAAVGLRYSA